MSGQSFMIGLKFSEVPQMYHDEVFYWRTEHHYSTPWALGIHNLNGRSFRLDCQKNFGTDARSIETEIEAKLYGQWGKVNARAPKRHVFDEFNRTWAVNFSPAEIGEYMIDGTLDIKLYVKILKINGFKEKARTFDESAKEFSDVVVKVNDKKFYVLKKFLASHSPYFKTLFFGSSNESKQSEIELKDVDSYDFQNFLEVLHGEPAVDDDTVAGILKLAKKFDSKTPMKRCEEFLVEKSKHSLSMKFKMAIKYKLDSLKKKCLPEIKTINDICSVLPADAHDFDQSVYVELIKNAKSLQ